MYTLFIIGRDKISQHNGLSRKFAKQLARIALERNELVQVLTPKKKMLNITLKEIIKNEI